MKVMAVAQPTQQLSDLFKEIEQEGYEAAISSAKQSSDAAGIPGAKIMIHLDGSSDKAGNAAIPVPRNDKASQVAPHIAAPRGKLLDQILKPLCKYGVCVTDVNAFRCRNLRHVRRP
jgi:hypothetical protein